MDNGAGPQGLGSIGATWELNYGAWPPQAGPRDQVLPRPERGARIQARQGNARPVTPPTPAPAPSRRCRVTAPTTPGRRSRPTTGRRSPPARGSGSSRRRSRARDTVIAGPSGLELGEVLRSRHRLPGHAQRGPPRRQRDLRAERLAQGLAPQALCTKRSTALDPVPTHLKKDAAPLSKLPLRAGARADLPSGARVPRRLADQGDRPGSRRRPAALGLRHGRQGQGAEHRRPRRRARVGASCCPSSRARRPRARRSPPPTALRGEPNRAYKTASNGG